VTAPASPLRERAQATYLRPDAETAVPAPRGKRCTRCLCCMAVISFGGESLCEACDDGTHPPLPEARRAAAIDLPAPTLTLTPAPVLKEKPMTITSGRRSGKAIDPAIKAAVLAEPASVSNCDLARKYKITDVTIGTWRKAAGIKSLARGRGPDRRESAKGAASTLTLTPALAPTPTPTPTLTPALAAPSTAEAETFWTDGRDARSAQADAPPEEVAATIQVNRAMLDGWWRRLSLSEKAALFTGELRIRVEGFVS